MIRKGLNYCVLLFTLILSGCQLATIDESCNEIRGSITESCVPTDMLILNSGGGDIDAAIRTANKTVYTHVEKVCDSACILIASAGIDRTACSDATYGFHQGTKKIGTERIIDFYHMDERIDSDWVEHIIRSTPNSELEIINAYQAKAMGIVDTVIYCY